ncbi:hypothetical protein SAMN04489729_7866 [Amycolatopsis lurida]|nr:hypothetical protein SAMN04489729_7866 [Amycolatopsis lurida]
MKDHRPSWRIAPIPAVVRETWPTVARWRWVSPLRLWGRSPGEIHLVVVTPLRDRASGQTLRLSELTDPDDAYRIYAWLWKDFVSKETDSTAKARR